ncbi:MAG: hypothetical protein AAFR96_11085 [Planctomycetota bacterium]
MGQRWWRIGGSVVAVTLAASIAAGLVSCGRSSAVQIGTGDTLVFPRVEARNLLDEDVVLPDALAGAPALVHVAFYQRQQLQINTWLARNEAIEGAIEGLRIVETPTMKRGWALIAGQIDNWMRSGIPTDDGRARTISMFVDTEKFRRALDLPSDEVNYVLLLDEQGRLLHVEEGVYDETKLARIIAAAGRG